MPFKARLTTEEHTALAEGEQAHYKAEGDGFQLDVTPVDGLGLNNVVQLQSAVSAARSERDGFKGQLKTFEGLDPVAARDALTKVADMANWKPEDKVQAMIDQQREALVGQHKTDMGTKETEITGLTGELHRILVENEAISAIAALAPDSVDLLLPHVVSKCKVVRTEDGRFHARVMGPDGNARIGDSEGNYLSVGGLVEEMKDQDSFARAFPGSGSSGSGAGGDTGAGGGGGNGKVTKIAASDSRSLGANLEKIASGEVAVDFEQ